MLTPALSPLLPSSPPNPPPSELHQLPPAVDRGPQRPAGLHALPQARQVHTGLCPLPITVTLTRQADLDPDPSTQVYTYDSTFVSPFTLLLFGGSITIEREHSSSLDR